MAKELKPMKVIKNERSGKSDMPTFIPKKLYTIDWDKVKDLEHIKIILKELNLSVNIERATDDIKPLLKEIT
jgi:hypothetical protein